ncbi:MAG: sugar nucleotide-binding protein [Verrucomicrobiota bacterium]
MIFLLGAAGYVGSAFRRELARAWLPHRAISRVDLDYANFRVLFDVLKQHRPDFVILCGGYTGRPNNDACETRRSETVLGNLVLAQTVAQACEAAGVRLGAVSSGSVFNGAWVQADAGAWVVRENLNAPDLAPLLASRSARIRGFSDEDPPNFTFENGASFYNGTKAVAESVLLRFPSTYVWRLHIPFEERDHPRNYLNRLMSYPRLHQNWNSLSHLRDFVTACLQIWNSELPGGAYNIVNAGYASTREIVAMIRRYRRPDWEPPFWADDEEFYDQAARTPRANCLLEARRLADAGIRMRPLDRALAEAIRLWGE